MIKWILILLVLLFNTHSAWTESILVENSEARLIGKQTEVLLDEFSNLTLSDVINQLDDFESCKEDVFVHFATPSTFWFHFSIENKSGDDLWLDIANSNLNSIVIYRLDAKMSLIDSIETGCLFDNSKHENQGFTFQNLLLEKKDKGIFHFFIKVKTNLVYEVPLYLGNVSSIKNNRAHFDYLSLFILGCFVIMIVYNLFIFFVTKDKIYIYYCFYLVAAVFTGSYLNNYPLVELFVGKNLAYNYLNVWLWILFFATSLFTIRFFDLKKTDPFFYKVILVFVVAFIALGVANLFVPLYRLANLNRIIGLLYYLVVLFYSYRLWFRGVKRAKLYCIGWSFMIIGAIMFIFVTSGLIQYNAFTRNISYFGATIEVLIFSFALARRINDLQISESMLNISLTHKNKELVDLNESLDSFNYHVSHDLKTVLNNTLALTKMINKYHDLNDGQRVKEILDKLEKVATNGRETVQSFLSLGRLDTILSDELQVELNLQNELNHVIEKHNLSELITVEVEVDEIHALKIHEKAFESVFLNLLTNSIKYNNSYPKAWIRFEVQGDEYVIIYRDNGLGIDLGKYESVLFKPFKRAGNSELFEGSGVGLFLVKRIVTSLNGEIKVESELGEGVTFTIRFNRNYTK